MSTKIEMTSAKLAHAVLESERCIAVTLLQGLREVDAASLGERVESFI